MKKMFQLLALVTLVGLTCWSAGAQTTTITGTTTNNAAPPSSFFGGILGGSGVLSGLANGIESSGLLNASNYVIAPYATYAPSAQTKVGGGMLVAYDFPSFSGTNGSIGMALGVDWLGSWSLISGNVTAQVATHPLNLQILSFLPQSVRDLTLRPFVLAGIGAPMSGQGGNGAVIWDVGDNIQFGHWAGGTFGAGICWGEWMNAGPQSGHRWHFFLNYQHGLPF